MNGKVKLESIGYRAGTIRFVDVENEPARNMGVSVSDMLSYF